MERQPYNVDTLHGHVDALAQKFEASGIVGIYKNGEPLLCEAYGFENREAQVPMRLHTRFCFDLEARYLLGLCIMLLADAKKLALSEKLSRFLPEYTHAEKITVRQLLQGSSGIPDYIVNVRRKELDKDAAHAMLSREEQFVKERLMCSQKMEYAKLLAEIGAMELKFKPGIQFEPRNCSEHVMLREIVEHVSGLSLYAFLKQNVFLPLHMNDTVEGVAGETSYAGRMQGKELVVMPKLNGGRAFTTTAGDLEKLLHAFTAGGLLSKSMWKNALRMNTEGIGLGFEDVDGTTVVADVGFAAGTLRLYFSQQSEVSYLVLLNEDQKMEFSNGEYAAFCPKLRREVEAVFTFPQSPRVVPCGRRYGYGAMDLEIAPEQVDFVPDAKSCLAICCIDRQKLKPFVLLEGNRAVGFIGLRVDKKKDEYLVNLLLIDRRFQGRGYGKILLQYGIEYLKARGAKELSIGVNRRNLVARRLYESVGFVADGVYEEGVFLKIKL
ncbi:MAG TPA: GNAT family N-acetyltransferase [Clostridia bacterium]|nr:GNAT family N-acetyltransferase [Clostridia bacterium]